MIIPANLTCSVLVIYQMSVCMMKVSCSTIIIAKTMLRYHIFSDIDIGTLKLMILQCSVQIDR